MSDNNTTPEDNTENSKTESPNTAGTQEGLSNLVNATLPQELHHTMQHVDNAMLQSQQAIQQSLNQSATLIANANKHLLQGGLAGQPTQGNTALGQGSPDNQTDNSEAQNAESNQAPTPQQGMQSAAHAEQQVSSALEQQNQILGTQMQAAMQQVQQSVHQASAQMQQANSAREQALTHLIQGQQQHTQVAPQGAPEQEAQPADGAVQQAPTDLPPGAQPE